MKKYDLSRLFPLLFLILFSITLSSQVPDGGTEIIRDPLSYYLKSGKGILTKVSVGDQNFTEALRYETPLDVVDPWNAQIIFQPLAGIQSGDVILVTFYGRTLSSPEETGEGILNVVIENKSTDAKVLYQNVTMGAEWKQYYAPVKTDVSLEQGNLNCAFFFGFPSQTVEVADIRFINYTDTKTLGEMPVTEISYIGREPDAPWRAEAQDRIEQIRKGNIEITVVDTFGNPVPDTEVSLSMLRHEFGFGSAIVASEYMTNSTYRDKIHDLFNEVVFENDLKWTSFIYKNSLQVKQVANVLDSMEQKHIRMRGHNVIWPSWQNSPTFLQNYEDDPERLGFEIDKRIDNICSFTRGKIVDWDVINEPYTNHDFMDILGNDVMGDWFRLVRNNDPYVKLYLNEYGILSSNGINYAKQDAYIETINFIDDLEIEVEGIGMQGHFSSNLTPIVRLKTVLDKFSALDKAIKVTEFDIAIDQEEVQADYTRDFLTMMFSHPSVKSVLMWGFWENRHWEPDAALYRSDWSIKPNGEAYRDLVFGEWWTGDTTLITDENGKVFLNGFLGTYSYSIHYGENENKGTLEISSPVSGGESNHLIISTEPGLPAVLTLDIEGETVLCEGESTGLSAEVPDGFSVKWFNIDTELEGIVNTLNIDSEGVYFAEITGKGITIRSDSVRIIVNELPAVNLQISGETTFCPGGSVNLKVNEEPSYTYRWFRYDVLFRGSDREVEVTESGAYKVEVNSNGCKSVSEEVAITKLDSSDPECSVGIPQTDIDISISPNPFSYTFNINLNGKLPFPCELEIMDIKGRTVYNKVLDNSEKTAVYPNLDKGTYILKIMSGKEIFLSKLIRH